MFLKNGKQSGKIFKILVKFKPINVPVTDTFQELYIKSLCCRILAISRILNMILMFAVDDENIYKI